jgi:hypothetical protein
MKKCNVRVGYSKKSRGKMGFPVMSVPLGYFPEGTTVEHAQGFVIRAPGMP